MASCDSSTVQLTVAPTLAGVPTGVANPEVSSETLRDAQVRPWLVSVARAAAVADDIGARIALRFDSQFITVTRNAAGEAIEGDATRPVDIVDVWTFARRHDASGPNWILASTAPTQP